MRALALLAIAVVLAGCGGSSGTRNTIERTDNASPRLTGQAAENAGRQACTNLPPSTLPENGSKADKIAALRAYLQSSHPNDDVQAMLKGCRAHLNL